MPRGSDLPHIAPSKSEEQGEEVAELVVDTSLYTVEALFRACYTLTDRCYLFLRQQGPDEVVVELRKANTSMPLADMVGVFANELINQRVRSDIAKETKGIREQIVAQAFAEADFRGSPPQDR